MTVVIIPIKYKCTQQELYSIAASIYTSLAKASNLALFAALKPTKYVPTFLTTLNTRLTDAKNMLDDDQRTAAHEIQRVKLIPLADQCTKDFRALKTYINDGFPFAERHGQYIAAGQNEYAKASDENWEHVAGLNTKMNAYLAVAANVTALTGGGMPAGFVAQVTGDTGAFASKYIDFKGTMQTGSATGAKNTANNGVYDDLMNLHDDAVVALEGNDELLKEFTFKDVKNIVSPPGSASLEVELKLAGLNTPIDGTVTIQSATGIAIKLETKDSVAKFVKVDPDKYHVHVVVPGHPDVEIVKEVNTGVNARLKITIE
jgi:hypothetical protein